MRVLIKKMKTNTDSIYIDKLLKTIPTTRYQGSKRKILPWLYDCIDGYEFHTVLDAFGGSGMLSYLFKWMGKCVTYNDLYKYNQIIGESFIENNHVLLSDKDVEFLLTENNATNSFIYDNFHGIYYLDEENHWLDMIIGNIEALNGFYEGEQLKYKKAIAYNALFQSCLVKRPYNLFHRKNLDMRLNDVNRGFGNKVTWDKPFPHHFLDFVKEINNSIFYSQDMCQATCQDVFTITGNYDLVYLDPPYMKKKGESNESADYLKCYHFLEGIANYKKWGDYIDQESINKRIKSVYATNYFKPSAAISVFERLIKKFRNSIVVLSYRYGGTPTIDELSTIMLKYKGSLDVFDRKYKYALNKQNGDAELNREYLLIGY